MNLTDEYPLILILETARRELKEVIEKYRKAGVPAFLLEGALTAETVNLQEAKAREIAEVYEDIIAKLEQRSPAEPEENDAESV